VESNSTKPLGRNLKVKNNKVDLNFTSFVKCTSQCVWLKLTIMSN